MGFIDVIKERAKANKKTIVLPETEDRRTYEAAAQILKEGIANIVLVGSEEAVKKGSEGLDISGAVVVDPATSEKTQKYIDKLVELRQKKGMTPEQAKEILLNQYLYYGVMMVKMGDADGMVSGACHSTADHLTSLPADPEDQTGHQTGIRFLPDGCSELRVRRKRNLHLRRFRSEPEPESGRAGSDRRFFCRVLQTPCSGGAGCRNAEPLYQGFRKTCRCGQSCRSYQDCKRVLSGPQTGRQSSSLTRQSFRA